MGLRFNELVASGRVHAPIVIGRDHLDAGSVASPYRETEGMRDGSDAIAAWPVFNDLPNTAPGAPEGPGHPLGALAGRPAPWSACSPPIPAPAWSATPTPATNAPWRSPTSAGSASRCGTA